ncbi:hypothetical protein COCMIDRAFT_8489 [Bipolaris oryzae ATCC 44560]|uniref:Uncharacterized protein n=1 Tax=Bipolaris oryzae ATCC 44560 TaxID=930090 RepID=W6YQZ5_COCMI|nr:uncharacterized protein COCMIDRAFT_8489 [Bipolaris oryzae ATCC 44560]EUC41862.1 hypothetical protein COCMIDRAFT_8489 [Bipolaris oryzae ATCC 44560]
MCLYWKKMHTCGHLSDRPYIEMCRPGLLSNNVCLDIKDDEQCRPSHFPCYFCIKAEARAEIEAQVRSDQEAIAKARQARENAVKEKVAAEMRAKEERVRREAREKATREREAEQRAKQEKEEDEIRAKKEGGPWIETLGGKKFKGKRNAGGSGTMGSPTRLLNSLSVAKMATGPKNTKENSSGNGDGGEMMGSKTVSVDMGGRAGVWGPKKILTRQENDVGTGSGTKK